MSDHSSTKKKQSKVIRMHLVDCAPLLDDASSLDDLVSTTQGLWSTIHEKMRAEETLWVFAPSTYRNGQHWPVGMEIAEFAREEADLILKNLITRHQEFESGGPMHNAYEEILFLVKDKRAYRFNKDAIRVAHVYKGKEWGGERETGTSAYHDTEVQRYNPEGKDPGNVWMDELRSQTDDETVDETRPISRDEGLRRCIHAGSREGETVHLWSENNNFSDIISDEDREPIVHSLAQESYQ